MPAFQYFYKPIGDDKVAVLLMNVARSSEVLTASFAKIPSLSCTHCRCAAAVPALRQRNVRGSRFAQPMQHAGQLCLVGVLVLRSVRDIWNHKDLGIFTDSWGASVDSHDSAFLVISP